MADYFSKHVFSLLSPITGKPSTTLYSANYAEPEGDQLAVWKHPAHGRTWVTLHGALLDEIDKLKAAAVFFDTSEEHECWECAGCDGDGSAFSYGTDHAIAAAGFKHGKGCVFAKAVPWPD